MKARRYTFLLLIITGVYLLSSLVSIPWRTLAITTMLETEVEVGVKDVIDDDLYLACQVATIEGHIKGDLLAASGSFTLDGIVEGDLFALARNTVILSSGRVGESARLAGEKVKVQGNVGKDLLLAGGEVNLEYGVTVGGDLVVVAQKAFIAGNVLGKVKVYANEVVILGVVGKDLVITAEKIKILPGAIVEGKLIYTSPEEAIIQRALLKGGMEWNKRTTRFLDIYRDFRIHPIWSFVLGFLALFMAGVFSFLLLPRRVLQIKETIFLHPLLSLALGFLFIILTPVLAILFFITLVGTPVGLFTLFIYLSVLYISRAYTGLFVGDKILSILIKKNFHPVLAMGFGLFILLLLSRLPWVGWLITLVAILMGIGSLVRVILEDYKKSRLHIR